MHNMCEMHKLKQIRGDNDIHIVSVEGDNPGVLQSIDQGGIITQPGTYSGPYEVTPSEETQVLATAGAVVDENIKINPIPSNYGRIAWNGSALLVY